NALKTFQQKYPDKLKIIKLSSNFGSYNAVLAGMKYATGDCTVVIGADLQDPPELIAKMYDYWQKGFRLVLANREGREDSLYWRPYANTYQQLIWKYAIPTMTEGGFDFRWFDRPLREPVVNMNENNTNSL